MKQFASLKKCVDDYRVKITNVKNGFRQTSTPKVITNSRKLVAKIAEALKERNVDNELTTDLASILKTMKSSVMFTGDMKTGITGTLDCTILKRKLHHLKDSVCNPNNFADNFASLSFYLLIMGPFLVLLGICMCCQIRLADRDKHKMPSHMKKRQ